MRSVWELGPGLTIVRDQVPVLSLARWHRPAAEGGGYSLTPEEADELALRIVAFLNAWSSSPQR
jgi:hypothetical protein